MIALRSVLFLIWFVAISLLMHIAAFPLLFLPRRAIMHAAKLWAWLILGGLKWITGLSYEVRGRGHLPTDGALVASKHFTMWETVALILLLPDPAIVLKRELTWIPFYGWYARKAGMIAVDRRGKGKALLAVCRAAERTLGEFRQIVIFPEGTRCRPGAAPAYKSGVAGLYAHLGVPCVPVAHNSGRYWMDRGLLKKPGTIIIEFLPPIPPGLSRHAFMDELQARIETATDRLLGGDRA